MTTLRRAADPQDPEPLEWATDGNAVWATCGNGHISTLDHAIALDGTVTPSVVCPYDGCDWHEFVTLEGWL